MWIYININKIIVRLVKMKKNYIIHIIYIRIIEYLIERKEI
jgi:hypothetical protein